MTRIKYTEVAAQDLEDIYRHIAEDNPVAADRHRQKLTRRCQELLTFPAAGRKHDEIRACYQSVSEGDYIIFYRMAGEDELVIMRVVHSKRDLGQIAFPE